MRRNREGNRMRKWMTILSLAVAVSISACGFQGHEEKDVGESKRVSLNVQQEQGHEKKDNNKTENKSAEQGRITLFSKSMSVKLPQGLEMQSNESSNSRLVYTDSHKEVKLEMRHDPEQLVTDAGIDMGRLKMKSILERDSEGE